MSEDRAPGTNIIPSQNTFSLEDDFPFPKGGLWYVSYFHHSEYLGPLGGGFKTLGMMIDDPIWRVFFFQMGWN